MKKLLLGAAVVLGAIISANAQGYYNVNFLSAPGNPGGINTDADFNTSSLVAPAGSTTILADIPHASSTPKYSTSQTIPFVFDFNGGPVTAFKANSSGYLTFSKKAVLANAGNTPAALPSALLPDSSVCVWGLCLAGLGTGTCIYTKVYGTAPHRQLWIDWFAATNPTDTCSINWWAIVLEETTNNIYMVDQAGGWYWNGCSTPTNPGLSLGVQVKSTLAYEVAGSPSISAIATSDANADNNYYEFIPGSEPAYAAPTVGTNISGSNYYGIGVAYPVTGTIANTGSTALTSLTLNWKCSDGHSGTAPATVSIAAPNPVSTAVAASTSWTPTAAGIYTMKLWATNLNGSHANQYPDNDTEYVTGITVIDSIQTKQVLFEEFMQASCNPCMYAAPNLDSVLTNNQTTCIPVRYHVSWPDRDYMNKASWIPYDSERTYYYYGVNSVPDAKLDGSTDVYPGTVNSAAIQGEAKMGSPFKISITSATYDRHTNVYSVKATIKAYGSFAAGLAADAVLTVDTIKYAQDQSQEDPPSSFPGTNPESYYQYVVNYPQVVEELMTGEEGNTLTAFTPYSTQALNVTWTKNHPWGTQNATWSYDSLNPGEHITVFVQNNTSLFVYQAATAPVTLITTGIDEVSDGVSFNLYPNPTNNNTNVAFSLDKDQNITVEVYNMLGEKVYSDNEGLLSSGQHTISINGSNFQNGVYFVRFTADNAPTIQKLIIQR